MISTTEIVILSGLVIALGIATWWFVIAFKYGKTVQQHSFARGANIDPGVGKTKGVANLMCDGDHEICVWRATSICTGGDANNFESSSIDSMVTGTGGEYNIRGGGAANLTKELVELANGQSFYSYAFDGAKSLPKCLNGTARPQLIATYSCIPKGSECKSYVPSV